MEPSVKKRLPYAVIVIAAANILYFLYLQVSGALNSSTLMAEKGALCIINGHYYGGWLPLFASMFIHFDIHHLGGNMLMLLVVGEFLEERLGRIRILAAYLASGLAGNAVTILWYCLRKATIISAGASGAVFGLVGMLCCLIFLAKGSIPGFSRSRVMLMIFLMLYSGFANSGINTAAHIGGFLTGCLAGLLYLKIWDFRD